MAEPSFPRNLRGTEEAPEVLQAPWSPTARGFRDTEELFGWSWQSGLGSEVDPGDVAMKERAVLGRHIWVPRYTPRRYPQGTQRQRRQVASVLG